MNIFLSWLGGTMIGIAITYPIIWYFVQWDLKRLVTKLVCSKCGGIGRIPTDAWERHSKPCDRCTPKRKWHKWSELKDKYFSKEKQKEMKEQA